MSTVQREAGKFFCRAPPLFFGSASTIRRFGKRFRDGQYSLVNLLFAVLLLTVSPCLAIIKSGEGTCLVLYMESAPLKICIIWSRSKSGDALGWELGNFMPDRTACRLPTRDR